MSILLSLEIEPSLVCISVQPVVHFMLMCNGKPPVARTKNWLEGALIQLLLELLMLLVIYLLVTLSPELEEVLNPSV